MIQFIYPLNSADSSQSGQFEYQPEGETTWAPLLVEQPAGTTELDLFKLMEALIAWERRGVPPPSEEYNCVKILPNTAIRYQPSDP